MQDEAPGSAPPDVSSFPAADDFDAVYRPEYDTESTVLPLPDGEITREEWLSRERAYETIELERKPLGSRGGRGRSRIAVSRAAIASLDDRSRALDTQIPQTEIQKPLTVLVPGAGLSDKLKELLFSNGAGGPQNYALRRQLAQAQAISEGGSNRSSSGRPAQASDASSVCRIYTKHGACRLGLQCPWSHLAPAMSRTVLLKGNWGAPTKPLVGDDALEAEFDEVERTEQLLALHEDLVSELGAIGPLRAVKLVSNATHHLEGVVFAFFAHEMDAVKAVARMNGRFYGGQAVHAELSPVDDWSLAACTALPTCSKGSSCPYPHFFETPEEQKAVVGAPVVRQPLFPSTPSSSLPSPDASTPAIEYIYTPADLRGTNGPRERGRSPRRGERERDGPDARSSHRRRSQSRSPRRVSRRSRSRSRSHSRDRRRLARRRHRA